MIQYGCMEVGEGTLEWKIKQSQDTD